MTLSRAVALLSILIGAPLATAGVLISGSTVQPDAPHNTPPAADPSPPADSNTLGIGQDAPPAPPGSAAATTGVTGLSDELWEPGRWTLQLEPTIWFAAMGGKISAGGSTEARFEDFDTEADNPNPSPALRGMYRQDRLSVIVDGFWLGFDEGNPAENAGELDFSLWSIDASVGWEVWEWKRQQFSEGDPKDTGLAVRVIPYAGLRVIAPDIKIQTGGSTFDESDYFVHPLVGLRIEIEILDRFSFDTGADVGGFDLLGEEAFAFDWSVGLRVHITPDVAAQIGFRQMFMDVESDDLSVDGSVGGLMATLVIRF